MTMLPEQFYLLLNGANISAFVTGAVQAKLNQGNLYRIPVVVPPKGLSTHFGKQVGSIFQRYHVNIAENCSLAKLRDTTLLRLLSGESRIKDAEKLVEAAT